MASDETSPGMDRLLRVLRKHLHRPIAFDRAWADPSCGPVDTTGLSESSLAAVVFSVETMTPRTNVRLDDPMVIRKIAFEVAWE